MCGCGGSAEKGAAQHAVHCRGVSVREPDCMRVPSQGPHGEGAVRCYTGNGPMRHAFCTRVRCGVRELRAGVDPIKILNILKILDQTYRFTWGRGRRTLAQDSGRTETIEKKRRMVVLISTTRGVSCR